MGTRQHYRATHVRRSCRWAGAAALVAAACLLSGIGALADASKCDAFVRAELAEGRRTGWSRVIVTTTGALTAPQQRRLRALGVDVVRHYTIVRGFACLLPARNLAALTDEPFVGHVSADVRVHKTDDYTVPATGADVAYSQYALDGTGVGVAVIDSGIQTGSNINADLRNSRGVSRVVAAVNFVAGLSSAADGCGHGTLVAGIIGGNGASSAGSAYFRHFPGMARNVNIVALRVLDANGGGNVSDAISAIQWAVSNARKYNIRVVNLSLGHLPGDYYRNDPLCQACESAWKAGIVVVAAAGNGGRQQDSPVAGLSNEGYGTAYGSIQSPGNDPYVVTVGAMKQDPVSPGVRSADRIATYSSRGPSRLDFVLKPDLVAPGNRVITTRGYGSTLDSAYVSTNVVPLSAYSTLKTGTQAYFQISGTSMSAPVVSGAVALMLQANSKLTPDTVKARLMVSADKWAFPDGTADPCTFGAGYLNIPAALACTLTVSQPALSPTLRQDGQGNVYIDLAIWGGKAIWGTAYPNGAAPPDCKAIWGDKAIWGTNILSSSAAVYPAPEWNDKAIWGDTTTCVDLSSKAISGE